MGTQWSQDEAIHVTIDGYPIDATISEDHTFESEISSYPVEVGSDVTDNVRPKPITITLNCIVTDTPMGDFLTDSTRQNGSLPSLVAYYRMKIIRDTRLPVLIRTSIELFADMVLTNLSVPRKADTGNAIEFTATFQQVIFVNNQRSTVRVASPSGAGKQNIGHLLGLKGKDRLFVFTVTGVDALVPILKPIFINGRNIHDLSPLVDSSGVKHYRVYDGSPQADGYFDKDGFHSMAGDFDPATGTWVNDKGKSITQQALGASGLQNSGTPPDTNWNNLYDDDWYNPSLDPDNAPLEQGPAVVTTPPNGLVGKDVPGLFGGG